MQPTDSKTWKGIGPGFSLVHYFLPFYLLVRDVQGMEVGRTHVLEEELRLEGNCLQLLFV